MCACRAEPSSVPGARRTATFHGIVYIWLSASQNLEISWFSDHFHCRYTLGTETVPHTMCSLTISGFFKYHFLFQALMDTELQRSQINFRQIFPYIYIEYILIVLSLPENEVIVKLGIQMPWFGAMERGNKAHLYVPRVCLCVCV